MFITVDQSFTKKTSWYLIASIVAIGLLKFFLIANQEIVTEFYDALNYVGRADQLGRYFGLGATGYTVWLWFSHAFGVPQRIAIELLWLISATYLSFSLWVHDRERWLILPCFAVAALAPQTYNLFDHAMTEGLYLCLSALALASSIRVLRGDCLRKRAGALLTMGLIIGYMAITRNESFLLVAFLIVWSFLIGVVDRFYRNRTWGRSLYGALGGLFVVSLSATVIPAALTVHNGWRYGVFTRGGPAELPSNFRLLKTLAMIETGEKDPRFVPITHRARELAYAQSPTFARFRDEVERPQNPQQQASLQKLGLPGEIGTAWLWYAFHTAAWLQGITSLKDIDAIYRQAIREIEAGFSSGKYQRRFVLHPFLEADPAVWMPFLGQGLTHSINCMLAPLEAKVDADLPPTDEAVFDRVCMRRLPLVSSSIHIEGWAFANNADHPITRVSINDGATETNRENMRILPPDVQKAFQRDSLPLPRELGFGIFKSSGNKKPSPSPSLSFYSGSEFLGKLDRFEPGKSHVFPGTHGNITVEMAAVTIRTLRAPDSFRERIKGVVLTIAKSSTIWITGLSLSCACLLMLIFFCQSESKYLLLASGGIFVIWVLLHICFYGLVSAAAWTAEPRYLQNSAFFCLFFIVSTVLSTLNYFVRWVVDHFKLLLEPF